MVGYRDYNWLKHSMNVLIGLFRWYGLADNVAKSCMMTCQASALMLEMSEDSRERKCTGVGASYWDRLRRRTPCPKCGGEITAIK